MGVPMISKKTGEKDDNPRLEEIDTAWRPIEMALHQRLGSRYLELMKSLDRGLWFACAARTDDWFVGYIKAHIRNKPEDEREAWDAAHALYANWLWNLYDRKIPVHTVQVPDVPFLLSNLPESFTLDPEIRGVVRMPKMEI